VNLAKADLPFAAAGQIPQLMTEFEKDLLHRFTPCRFDSRSEVIEALTIVHAELILIHPFREGNGRVARLLANLMASQAGLPLLDFGVLKGRRRKDYFGAVRAGLDRDYKPMERLFSGVVDKSLRIRPRG
jgi:cell filamentation protein